MSHELIEELLEWRDSLMETGIKLSCSDVLLYIGSSSGCWGRYSSSYAGGLFLVVFKFVLRDLVAIPSPNLSSLRFRLFRH